MKLLLPLPLPLPFCLPWFGNWIIWCSIQLNVLIWSMSVFMSVHQRIVCQICASEVPSVILPRTCSSAVSEQSVFFAQKCVCTHFYVNGWRSIPYLALCSINNCPSITLVPARVNTVIYSTHIDALCCLTIAYTSLSPTLQIHISLLRTRK